MLLNIKYYDSKFLKGIRKEYRITKRQLGAATKFIAYLVKYKDLTYYGAIKVASKRFGMAVYPLAASIGHIGGVVSANRATVVNRA